MVNLKVLETIKKSEILIDKLIIDANLLLLLVIGSVESGKYIKKSKKLNGFDLSDYDVVVKVINNCKEIYITPYIAAEVSNLIDLKGYAFSLAYDMAREFFSIFKEIDSHIETDCNIAQFNRFGITDSSLIKLASSHMIFTNDNKLLPELYAANCENVFPFAIAKNVCNKKF